jgi:hypothetical protein
MRIRQIAAATNLLRQRFGVNYQDNFALQIQRAAVAKRRRK